MTTLSIAASDGISAYVVTRNGDGWRCECKDHIYRQRECKHIRKVKAMTTDLVTTNSETAAIVERVVLAGDLSKLSAADRVSYYRQTCESLGLNPLTRPFEYITLNGKLTLYARKDATEQLRYRHNVSVAIVGRELVEGVYVVTARATTPSGRTDESIGAVAVEGLKGEARANAYMKAETKGKRRVTLSIVGLGWLDETEVSSIPDARPIAVSDTGEIIGARYEPAPVADTNTGEVIEEKPAPAASGKSRPQNADEAERRFFAKYGQAVGGKTWADVQRFLGHEWPKPVTIDGWIGIASAVQKQEAASIPA